MNTISDYVTEAYETAKEHGWYDEPASFGEQIALCHSELSEALEEYRKGFKPNDTYYSKGEKPEGIPSELADCAIRIFDMCGYYGIDLEHIIKLKMEYNRTRPYRHGGKVL